jgi:hypothetical protein
MVGLDLPIEPERQQLVDLKVNGEWPLTRPTIADHVQRLYIVPRKDGIVHVGGHYFGKKCDPDNYDQGADQEYIEDVSMRATDSRHRHTQLEQVQDRRPGQIGRRREGSVRLGQRLIPFFGKPR